jgi:hypothetical protein
MEVEKVFMSSHEKFAPNLKVKRVKVECVANKIRFNRMNRRVKLMSNYELIATSGFTSPSACI